MTTGHIGVVVTTRFFGRARGASRPSHVRRRTVSRADADRLYSGEWRPFVEKKFGSPPTIDFLNSPVMIDNRDRMNA
jgi:hypothetical protein